MDSQERLPSQRRSQTQQQNQTDNQARSSMRQQHLQKLMKQYQGYQAQSNQSTENPSLQIYSPHLVPLFQALKNQNAALRSEKAMIAQEFKRLDAVTQVLVSQNEQMQKHCTLRTLDLKKIVQTISLNHGEQQNDLKHRVHLLRQENNIIIKRISQSMKQQTIIEQELIETQNQGGIIASEIAHKDLNFKDIQTRLSQLKKQIQKLQQIKQKSIVQFKNTQDSINQLLITNNILKSDNKAILMQLQQYNNQLNNGKSKTKNQNYRLHSSILELKKTIKNNQLKLNDRDHLLKQLNEQSNRLKKQLKIRQSKIEQNNMNLKQKNQKLQRLNIQLQNSKQRESSVNNELIQANKNREQLIHQLEKLQAQSNKRKNYFEQSVKQKKLSYAKIIQNLQSNLNRKEVGFSHQLNSLQYTVKQLTKQKQLALKQQNEIDRKINELEKSLEQSKEVIRQLQKVEYQVRQRQNELQELKNFKK